MSEHPIKQEINCITGNDIDGEFVIKIGEGQVTKIEATEKSGEYSNIPYIRVWKGDVAMAEFSQHKLSGVFFKTAALLLMLTLSACGEVLTLPGAPQAVIDKDVAACHYEAVRATGGGEIGMMQAENENEIFTLCLKQKGYVRK